MLILQERKPSWINAISKDGQSELFHNDPYLLYDKYISVDIFSKLNIVGSHTFMFKCRFKQQSHNNYRSPIIAYNKYKTQQRYSIYANTTQTYSDQYGIVVQESKTNQGSTTNAGTMSGTKGNMYLVSNDRTLSWVDGSAGGGVLNENHMLQLYLCIQ